MVAADSCSSAGPESPQLDFFFIKVLRRIRI